jgi:DNA-binding transcriptional LysR family regulator
MELTPRAQALRGPLAQALDQVRGLFIPDDFDAMRSERRFRLMMPDLAVELLVPPLMERLPRWLPTSSSTSCRGAVRRSSPRSLRARSIS